MSPQFGFSPRLLNVFRRSTVLIVATSLILLTSIFVIQEKVNSATSATTIVTCVNKKTGAMRLLLRGSCNTKIELIVHWSHAGPEGELGEVGPSGPSGPQGSTGVQGVMGERGPSGPAGPMGPMGPTGSAGTAGAAGSTGTTGSTGATGGQGSAGTGGTDSSFGFVPKNVCGSAGNSACTLGSKGPGGGTIVFIDFHNMYPAFDYQELAPVGWNGTTDDPLVAWCDNTTTSVNPTRNVYPFWVGRQIGQGATNTNDILALCTSGAGVLAHNYHSTNNGVTYTDWILPVLGALMGAYINNFGAGSFEAEVYWTSSEYSATQAWSTDFGQFDQAVLSKSELHAVRPMRHF